MYHNYQIYLDFAHTSHTILLSVKSLAILEIDVSKSTDRMANSVDSAQFDLGLHCLVRPTCSNI